MILSPNLFMFYNGFTISQIYALKDFTSPTETKKINYIITPKVIAYGKEYFACDDFPGVPLEDEGEAGSVGSHWEKLVLGNELMTSAYTGKPVTSNFLLSLMEDSGWYKPDYGKAEIFVWGKGEGC